MDTLKSWIEAMPGGRFIPADVLETDEKVELLISDYGYGKDAALVYRLFRAEYEPFVTADEDGDTDEVFLVPQIVADLLVWYGGEEDGFYAEDLGAP